jgi:glycosyltransferase involved in cell wall biosynthesis
MACGSPVIAFDVPFNREVAKRAALYFTSPSELRKAIDAIERDHEKAAIMGQLARGIVEQEYSTSVVVKGYEHLLVRYAVNKA